MPKFNSYKNRFITRLDYRSRGNHGWWVRVDENVARKYKLFSDLKNGGKGQALRLARLWRDKTEVEVFGHDKKHYHPSASHRRDSRCKTGVVGVSLFKRKRPYANGGYFWDVSYRAVSGKKGSQQIDSFSVKKYGKRMAFQLACHARQKGVQEIRWKKTA